eukprot:gene28377-34260_t
MDTASGAKLRRALLLQDQTCIAYVEVTDSSRSGPTEVLSSSSSVKSRDQVVIILSPTGSCCEVQLKGERRAFVTDCVPTFLSDAMALALWFRNLLVEQPYISPRFLPMVDEPERPVRETQRRWDQAVGFELDGSDSAGLAERYYKLQSLKHSHGRLADRAGAQLLAGRRLSGRYRRLLPKAWYGNSSNEDACLARTPQPQHLHLPAVPAFERWAGWPLGLLPHTAAQTQSYPLLPRAPIAEWLEGGHLLLAAAHAHDAQTEQEAEAWEGVSPARVGEGLELALRGRGQRLCLLGAGAQGEDLEAHVSLLHFALVAGDGDGDRGSDGRQGGDVLRLLRRHRVLAARLLAFHLQLTQDHTTPQPLLGRTAGHADEHCEHYYEDCEDCEDCEERLDWDAACEGPEGTVRVSLLRAVRRVRLLRLRFHPARGDSGVAVCVTLAPPFSHVSAQRLPASPLELSVSDLEQRDADDDKGRADDPAALLRCCMRRGMALLRTLQAIGRAGDQPQQLLGQQTHEARLLGVLREAQGARKLCDLWLARERIRQRRGVPAVAREEGGAAEEQTDWTERVRRAQQRSDEVVRRNQEALQLLGSQGVSPQEPAGVSARSCGLEQEPALGAFQAGGCFGSLSRVKHAERIDFRVEAAAGAS